MWDIAEAKERLRIPELWQGFNLSGQPRASCRSPFRDDKHASFSVSQDGKLFKDFATGDAGDAVTFLQRATGLSRGSACKKFIELAAFNVAPEQRRQTPSESPHKYCFPSDIYEPTDENCRDAKRMAEALISDSALCERIARSRGWKLETILQLGKEMYLGWQGEHLCFIYDTGAKLRQWRCKGERVIWWAFGKPWLWRGAWIKSAHTVYVCEGEPDCISLIDAGIENDRGTVAIAMPSASTFDGTWAALFDGKHVILTFDNDRAGSQATARVSKLLRPSARSLKRLNWEGLQYASAS